MANHSLFSVIGIEIEYMLVNQALEIQPVADKIFQTLSGRLANEHCLGDISVSNELVLHVLELKNTEPLSLSFDLTTAFQQAIFALQPALNSNQVKLLPTAAHPWMNPSIETQRWPHGNQEIYQQYDRIFNCQGHGWSNLQSMHINLPFANDEEFNRLHNAIRLILPLIPAIAASSPLLENKLTNYLDSRLYFYDKNQQRIPSITGNVIPEFIKSKQEYQKKILQPMYQDISPYDNQGILQYEWLNSRGAIPKFEYNAIEIRITDSQECVQADIAIAKTVTNLLKHWINQSDYYLDKPYSIKQLRALYNQTIKQGLAANITDTEILTQWQLPKRQMTVQEAWSKLIEKISTDLDNPSQRCLEYVLSQGNLSQRIIKACNKNYSKQQLLIVYQNLADCLLANQMFCP